MRVPMVDLGPQHAALRAGLEAAFGGVLTSSQLVLGPEVERFEAAAATYLGSKHAVGVSSGTDALLVSLMALGVGPGDEVVTTPLSFFATVGSILRLGARPRFVDVDRTTLNIDVARIDEAVAERTRAVVPVHLYGNPASLDAMAAVTARHGIALVEDAAQAFGARYGDRAAGAWGTLGCFSFFPTKILGALGDAGLVVTDDAILAARCRRLRQHGAERRGEHTEVGGNFRLDAIQAAMLRVKMRHVGEWIAARRAHGAAYDAVFHGLSGLEVVVRGEGWNGAVYTVRVLDGRRQALRSHLAERGVETAVYYDRPLHLQPALAHLGIGPGAFPESERAAGEVLSLPIFSEMTAAQRDCVIDRASAFFR